MPSSIEVSSAGSSSLVRSSNDDEQTLRPVLSFLSVSAPVGVFSPSAPQLSRYTSTRTARLRALYQ